jgi:hypothetical protein
MTASSFVNRAGRTVMAWYYTRICTLSCRWDPWRDAVIWTVADLGNMPTIRIRRFILTCLRHVDSLKIVWCVVVQATSFKFCGPVNCSEKFNGTILYEWWRIQSELEANHPWISIYIYIYIYKLHMIVEWCQEIIVNTATRLRAGRFGFDSRQIFSRPHLCPLSLLSRGYWGFSLRQ